MLHIVIIGAGECGARAAFALREKQFDGRITLVGAEEHLPYERPPLSKEALLHGHEPKLVLDAARYAQAGIEVLTSVSAESINPAGKSVLLSNGNNLAYDQLLLTTGARPRPFPGFSGTNHRIRTLRTHGDAVEIRNALQPGKHLAVIGGGFIGLELAATARKLGAQVTLLEGLPRILTRGVPEAVAAVVAERHKAEGVEILCGARNSPSGYTDVKTKAAGNVARSSTASCVWRSARNSRPMRSRQTAATPAAKSDTSTPATTYERVTTATSATAAG